MHRIAIIGNAGGGKTTLARLLGDALDLPVYHVDSIQYQAAWVRTPQDECDRRLNELASESKWVIDGFGSREVMERRFGRADTVLFVDFPLLVHYWWACKRQWNSRKRPRQELPEDCPEFSLSHSWRLAKIMWKVHTETKPFFVRQIDELRESVSLIRIRSKSEWRSFAAQFELDSEK